MKRLQGDPGRIVILGAGKSGTAMLNMLQSEKLVEVIAVVDRDAGAPGMDRAGELGITTFTDVESAIRSSTPCTVFNFTGDKTNEEIASEILGAGAVIGGGMAKMMWKMVSDLHTVKEKLEFQALHDELTGLFNRRHMLAELRREIYLAVRYKNPFSLALLDLDYFKKFNDVYGHAIGDSVLCRVSEALKHRARVSDVIGRWGGEEFLVLLPQVDMGEACRALELWLEEIKGLRIDISDNESVPVTFSAGVSSLAADDRGYQADELVDMMLARADENLYRAKDQGRARIVGN